MLKPGGTYGEGDEALEFYAKHTAQIEVSGPSHVGINLTKTKTSPLSARRLTRISSTVSERNATFWPRNWLKACDGVSPASHIVYRAAITFGVSSRLPQEKEC